MIGPIPQEESEAYSDAFLCFELVDRDARTPYTKVLFPTIEHNLRNRRRRQGTRLSAKRFDSTPSFPH